MNNELQNIISGKGATASESIILATARYLTASQNASGKTNPNEFTKEQEAAQLIKFVTEHQFWYPTDGLNVLGFKKPNTFSAATDNIFRKRILLTFITSQNNFVILNVSIKTKNNSSESKWMAKMMY